jgi:hypothetical protein
MNKLYVEKIKQKLNSEFAWNNNTLAGTALQIIKDQEQEINDLELKIEVTKALMYEAINKLKETYL